MCEFLVDCIIEQYVSVLRVLCFFFVFFTEIYFENDAFVVNCFYMIISCSNMWRLCPVNFSVVVYGDKCAGDC